MNKKCSIFKDAFDDTSEQYVSVTSILKAIKEGKWKDQILQIRGTENKEYRDKLKLMVPGACFSGTFKKEWHYNQKKGKKQLKARLDDHILSYTGIVVMDIDIKNEKIITRLKNMLIDDPYVYSFFLSPSGGLKVLYVVDSSAEHHKKFAYEQVKSWMEDNYDIEVDKSGKNLSRLCYVSYDPDLYINDDYVITEVDTNEKEEEFVQHNVYNYDNAEDEHNVDAIFEIASKWVTSGGKYYAVGSRNDYIHDLTCILNRAGVHQHQIISVITKNHSISSNMIGELKDTVSSACNRNRGEFGTKPIKRFKKNKSQDLTNFM